MQKFLFSFFSILILVPSIAFASVGNQFVKNPDFENVLIVENTTEPQATWTVYYFDYCENQVDSFACWYQYGNIIDSLGNIQGEFNTNNVTFLLPLDLNSNLTFYSTNSQYSTTGTAYTFERTSLLFSSDFYAMISSVSSAVVIIVGFLIALFSANYILRYVSRLFNHDPVLERARSVRGHTDAILRARAKKGNL